MIFYIIIIIYIFFFIINNFLSKKNYENFKRMENGLLCGTQNNICRLNENNISSCCDGYRCIRPNGNYQYKICVDKDKLINYNLSTNLNTNSQSINSNSQSINQNSQSIDQNSASINPKIPDINFSNSPSINPKIPNINFPEIKQINLYNVENVQMIPKDFWKNIFNFDYCPSKKNIS
jgi:hypothetical protein